MIIMASIALRCPTVPEKYDNKPSDRKGEGGLEV